MAAIIGELKREIAIPYGVNVLWDPGASIDLAMATEAQFVREIFTGVYASDFGLWNTNAGEVVRHQHAISAEHVRLFFNIVPESAAYLGSRQITDIARSTVFNARPDALAVSGLTAGSETSAQTLRLVKEAVPDVPVFANTGVRLENVTEQLAAADGAVVGDVGELVPVLDRHAAPGLLLVQERLDQQGGREDLVARGIEQVGAGDVGRAHRLALAAAQAVLDRLGDGADLRGLEDQALGADQ